MIEATCKSYQSVFTGLLTKEIPDDFGRLPAGEGEKLKEYETKYKNATPPWSGSTEVWSDRMDGHVDTRIRSMAHGRSRSMCSPVRREQPRSYCESPYMPATRRRCR